ncbi:MAG: outer membrane protein assembly factor BamD [bacterium]|nr:outer membrane protein assembly factor BamD [candidate division KSB1 bacterium]MDH7560204.1 outer membrane protein assembly factor BamD [bacterium]
MRLVRTAVYLSCVAAMVLASSCSKSKIRPNLTAEERLALAKQMFAKGDYLDAKQQLLVLTLSFQGSAVADEAQFYLAECHYQLKEYVLAISEYERLLVSYPNSQYVDDAEFKIGMSHFKLSPSAGLDQENARKAMEHFQRFLEDYPDSPLKKEVEASLQQCRNKLAKKEYDTGTLYRKMGYYDSALIYFDSVLATYYDTQYGEKALFWKGECLMKLGRHQEAQEAFSSYAQRYPKGAQVGRVHRRLKELSSRLGQEGLPAANPGRAPK